MLPRLIVASALSACLLITSSLRGADDTYRPSDPIAAIDGEPIFLGELNLILTQRFKTRELNRVNMQVQQATAALLVRRHLAMKSLRQEGGEALEALIERQVEHFSSEAKRRGSSLEQQARASMADEQSLVNELSWQVAWSRYLKSRLTESNLRRFFEKHRDRYAGNRWEVSQILVKVDSRDAASVSAALKNVRELADQIRASEDVALAFAEAARDHSDAPSANDGGMVGWVSQDGDLPSSVMEAVRRTPVGQVSDPVASPLGIHLVFVHRKEPGKLTFDDLTDLAQLRRDAADALFDALVARQRNAKVTWFIRALRPPQDVSIVPN